MLLPLLGVNHCLPILYMSQNNMYMNSIGKRMNQFAIEYIVNPTLKINKVFSDQVEKKLEEIFHSSITSGIKM